MTTAPTAPETMIDPMDAAMAAQAQPSDRTYFGEVTTVDVFFCVLEKGRGKVLFDAGQHQLDQRRTAIKLIVVPTKGEYELTQDTIDTAQDWLKHTLPSLRKIGQDLRTIKGKFVQLKRVPTGETYTNKHGESKEKSALVFLEVYPDRASCQAAAEAFFTSRGQRSAPAEQPAAAPSPSADSERAFALGTLSVLWQAAGKDPGAFLAMIAANPMISKHVTADSPEVQHYTQGIPF